MFSFRIKSQHFVYPHLFDFQIVTLRYTGVSHNMDKTFTVCKSNCESDTLANTGAWNHAIAEDFATVCNVRNIARTLVSIVATSPVTSRTFQLIHTHVTQLSNFTNSYAYGCLRQLLAKIVILHQFVNAHCNVTECYAVGTELLEHVAAQDEHQLEHTLQRHLYHLLQGCSSKCSSNACVRKRSDALDKGCNQRDGSPLMPQINELHIPKGREWQPFDDFVIQVFTSCSGFRATNRIKRGHV